MAEEHQEHADDLEAEVGAMEKQSERLESEIDQARTDWERKQSDESVPGATGIPDSQRGIAADGSGGSEAEPQLEEEDE